LEQYEFKALGKALNDGMAILLTITENSLLCGSLPSSQIRWLPLPKIPVPFLQTISMIINF